MGWNTLYYGVPAPSRGRRIAIHGTLIVMALAFYGGWIDFLPEPWVDRSCFWVSLVLGVMATAWLTWVNLSGRNESYRGGKATMLLCAPLCIALATGFFWFALAHGVAGGTTRVLGDAAFLPPVQMHTDHRWRRRECDYQLRGGPMTGFLSDHLCTSSTYYEAHPRRRVEVLLGGFRGRLGFYVTQVSHHRDLGAYPYRD